MFESFGSKSEKLLLHFTVLTGCVVQNARTAVYAAIFDKKGECILGLGDMDVHNQITVDLVSSVLFN